MELRIQVDDYHLNTEEARFIEGPVTEEMKYVEHIGDYYNCDDIILGTAESIVDAEYFIFSGDFNQNGKEELYRKNIWRSSSMNGADCLSTSLMTESQEWLKEGIDFRENPGFMDLYDLKTDQIPVMCWLDAYGEKNLFCMLFRSYEGPRTIELNGYYLSDTSAEQVMHLPFTGEWSIRWDIYTAGINTEFKTVDH